MKKEKTTLQEQSFLFKKYKEEKKDIYFILLFTISLVSVVIFIPKNKNPSLFERFGFLPSFLLLFFILFPIYFFQYKRKLKMFKTDIYSGLKVIEKCKIVDKDTNMKNECFITIDFHIKKLINHKISKNDFQKLKIGDFIEIEYFEMSNILLKINF